MNRFLSISVIIIILFSCSMKANEFTFKECKKVGGFGYRARVVDPDVCPSCVSYFKCRDFRKGCSSCGEKCSQCKEKVREQMRNNYNTKYNSCEKCRSVKGYNFKNIDDQNKHCPDCPEYKVVNNKLIKKMRECPPCVECWDCENKNRKKFEKNCPVISSECASCMTNPPRCPENSKQVGKIIDSPVDYRCCKEFKSEKIK